MLDRASIVDEQFHQRIKEKDFPKSFTSTTFKDVGIDKQMAINLFDSQIKSRLLDIIARQLKEKGLSFYTIGSSGHEGNAVLGHVFRVSDMSFLHYRSGAFYIQRAKQVEGHDGVDDILQSLVAAASDPISGGRHKVFGNVALNIPPQTSTIASHVPKALGTALSITRAKELNFEGTLPHDSVILCSFGDASLNHATTQTTLNACGWIRQQSYPLPLIFVCEDNGIGISVSTPKDWVESSIKHRPGIHYIACDGLNIADVYRASKEAEYIARTKKQPVFLHIKCVRLLGHAGSDIEFQYRSQSDIESTEANDPLLHTASMLVTQGIMTVDDVLALYESNRQAIQKRALEVINLPKMTSAQEVMASMIPPKGIHSSQPLPSEQDRSKVFGSAWTQLTQKRNMCQLINATLTDLMLQYSNMMVFGEDVGKKGGVYRVTADLQARFGQRRVFDTLLDETTILGTAIGMAHNGFIPVPEIQFLAYLHNAQDQLRGEAATLSFFSSGQYQNPMVIRIASLAYQKGFGGHFHNDNSIAVLRDLPGVVVACPSNGPDAARLLRTCMKLAHEDGRVVVFLEPIALYMMKDLHEPGDNLWLNEYPDPKESIELGDVTTYGDSDTVIITYGNGTYLSQQAAKILEDKYHALVKIIDIHWLNPLPIESIVKQLAGARRVLIVDEGRRSGSVSEALITMLHEYTNASFRLSRYTGEDSFIPLGQSWTHVLPSRDGIVQSVLNLFKDKRESVRGRLVIS